jgi:hypothetical protein
MALSRRMQVVRRSIGLLFLFACVSALLIAVTAVVWFLLNPFAGFDGRAEFAELSGADAKLRLRSVWPPAVEPESVRTVSQTTQWSRDSSSSWCRVELRKEAATIWMDHIHAEEERRSKECFGDHHECLEGVHRVVSGPPALRRQTGNTPAWWSPPAIAFRATEVMLWYGQGDSGVGRATYSGFDESTDVLWIYDYACQHDELWSRGKPPKGIQIHLNAKK